MRSSRGVPVAPVAVGRSVIGGDVVVGGAEAGGAVVGAAVVVGAAAGSSPLRQAPPSGEQRHQADRADGAGRGPWRSAFGGRTLLWELQWERTDRTVLPRRGSTRRPWRRAGRRSPGPGRLSRRVAAGRRSRSRGTGRTAGPGWRARTRSGGGPGAGCAAAARSHRRQPRRTDQRSVTRPQPMAEGRAERRRPAPDRGWAGRGPVERCVVAFVAHLRTCRVRAGRSRYRRGHRRTRSVSSVVALLRPGAADRGGRFRGAPS